MKLFSFDARTRSFADKVSGVVPVNVNLFPFKRESKGYSLFGDGTNYLNYGNIDTIPATESFTILCGMIPHEFIGNGHILKYNIHGITFKLERLGWMSCYLRDNVGGNTTWCSWSVLPFNIPVHFAIVIDRESTYKVGRYVNGIFESWRGSTVGLGDISNSDDFQIGSKSNMFYLKIKKSILSNAEIQEDYQEFLHSSPTSTPNIIRHRIPVDPSGSVLTFDFQTWAGGHLTDLSGNGHLGQPIGFVDCGIDGARFVGSSYIDCGFSGGITGNLTIEALVKKNDIIGQEGVINKGTSALLGINYYLGFDADELQYIISDGVSSQDITTTTLNMIADEWYYVVVTVDGSFITSYVNGVEILQTVQTVTPTANINDLLVGCMDSTTNRFNGCQKFIRVLPYTITESQIKNNWNKIARLVGLNVMGSNLLPDNKIYTVGEHIEM